MYNKIIVAHGGMEGGDIAIKHAAELSNTSPKCQIILLHVVEKPSYPYTFGLSVDRARESSREIERATAEGRKAMDEELNKKARELQNSAKNKLFVSVKTVIGNPSDEIIKLVRKEKPDLLVMAKRQKLTGLKGVLALGSVSRKMAEKVPCPILLVDLPKE